MLVQRGGLAAHQDVLEQEEGAAGVLRHGAQTADDALAGFLSVGPHLTRQPNGWMIGSAGTTC
jgi:hypothetical protein